MKRHAGLNIAAAILAALAWPAFAANIVTELGLREAPEPVRMAPGWSPAGPIVVRVDSAERLAGLQLAAGNTTLLAAASDSEALALMADARGLLGFCSNELIAAAPRLHWIQLYSAGSEYCLAIPEVRERGLLVTNMQRVSSPEIAEHVMAMLLSFTRGLHAYGQAQSEGLWDPDRVPMQARWELADRTLLLVGLGGIGTEVARRAKAFGMRVVAIRASDKPGPAFVDSVARPDALLKLAADADAIVNSAPLTADTEQLFNAGFFRAMKPSAYFINVGRGRSVVTEDLVAALQAGQLAGAGLDVTDPEPLPPDHPLWRMPNVIITPHVSAGSDRVRDRIFAVVAENLRRYAAGEPMLSVVDAQRGY